MMCTKSPTRLLLASAVLLLLMAAGGCGRVNEAPTLADLLAHPRAHDGKTVTVEGFYFSGFEISVLAESMGPAPGDPSRTVPQGKLIWVQGISQEVYDQLHVQYGTPSGYPERFGKVRVTGVFEAGSHYGHLDAYDFQLRLTASEAVP